MNRRLFLVFSILLLLPFSNLLDVYGQTEFDSVAMGLPMPKISMNPSSGPPGTEVEIIVENMSAMPDNLDPRIEFFVYLPFVSAIGSNVPNNCGGESCFALYSFEEVGQGKFAPKTITFSLFSKSNPAPLVEAGWMESVCDLKINGQTIERYGKICTDNDLPVGKYEIKFGWGIQRSDLYDVRNSMTFTVTEKELITSEREQDADELAMEQFLAGEISESEFEEKLVELGYDFEEIRQAKALIGKLEHQEGFQAPLKTPVQVPGTDFKLTYGISGGVVKQVTTNTEENSLIVQIDSTSNGTLAIKLPREVIDAKFGEDDDDFFVLLDGLETDFEESKTGTDRTLTIEYPDGTEEVEIIGTFVIPEFGTLVGLILIASVVSVIAISRTKMGFNVKV